MQTLTPVVPAAPLVMSRDAQSRSITIHTLDLDGPAVVGTYTSAADAWRAIDALDMPAAEDIQLAA